tara:strand:+ start:146 stop:1048 length:903 start_codon:yes stop_codon:yes gene_type:complete
MNKKINFNHSLVFFNLCIILSAIEYLKSSNLNLICLFLILSIGISHGSLDNLKGKKLLKIYKIKSVFLFYMAYIFLSLLIILFWLLFPQFLLMIFLLVASYHFGKEDSDFIIDKKIPINQLIYFLKGLVVIIAPLLFHKKETLEIFGYLNLNILESILVENDILIFFLFASLVSSFLISDKKSFELKSILIMDFISILMINYFLSPILAFTVYFCFLHSIRHSISLIFELNSNFNLGLKEFIRKAIPLTLLTVLAYLFSLLFLNNYYSLDEAIYKVIFIGLASLTFPHILLEYLIEKNEK